MTAISKSRDCANLERRPLAGSVTFGWSLTALEVIDIVIQDAITLPETAPSKAAALKCDEPDPLAAGGTSESAIRSSCRSRVPPDKAAVAGQLLRRSP